MSPDELATARTNGRVGSTLVSTSGRVRVWHIALQPGERLAAHCHVLDYFWTATSAGRASSTDALGQVSEHDYALGETSHMSFAEGQSMVHDLTNTGDTRLTFVTVEFLEGANPPLPI